MAELITKDMQLYHEIKEINNLKTEQLHISLVAAVNSFHKFKDDVNKEDLAGKSKLHRDVPAKIDFGLLVLYFLYFPK